MIAFQQLFALPVPTPLSLVVPTLLVLLAAAGDASPTRMERMTVSKMRMADLETSATGYAYNQQQGLPASYVRYTNHGSGRYYHAPGPVHYVLGTPAPVAHVVPESTTAHRRYEPAVLAYTAAERGIVPYAGSQSYAKGEIANYGGTQLSKYAPVFRSRGFEARAPYYEETFDGKRVEGSDEAEDSENEEFEKDEKDEEEESKDDVEKEEEEEVVEEDEKVEQEEDEEREEDDVDQADFEVSMKNFDFHDTNAPKEVVALQAEFPSEVFTKFNDPYTDVASSFKVRAGTGHGAEVHSAHGREGDKSYKENREFSEAEHEKHDKDRREGYYEEDGGYKGADRDDGGVYGFHDETEKGQEGGGYERASYHKNERKTSGFHKVYRKDEYKKNTDFYDDRDDKGHFDKYALSDEYHGGTKGNFEKGESRDSDFDNRGSGKEGSYDKGQEDIYGTGYNGEKGEDSYYENYEKYAEDSSANETREESNNER